MRLRAHCAEISWDRHRQTAYEIFSIERGFRRSKSRFLRFKKTCALWASNSGTSVKVVILPLLLASLSRENDCRSPQACCPWQALVTSFLVVWHRWLWKTLNFQNKGFYWFLRSSAAAQTPRMNCGEMAGDWQFANRNCYRLSRVSWALAQIYCCYHSCIDRLTFITKMLKTLKIKKVHNAKHWDFGSSAVAVLNFFCCWKMVGNFFCQKIIA